MEKTIKQSNGGQILVAVLIGTIGSGLLFSASLAVPIFGFISALLAPLPLGIARIKGGATAAGFATLLTTLLIAILFSPPVAAWYAVQCGLIGLAVAELILKGLTPAKTILWCTALTISLSAIMILIFSLSTGTNLQSFAQKEITDGINQAIKLYEKQSALPAQDFETLKQGMTKAGQLISRIYPALATINLALISTISVFGFIKIAVSQSIPVNKTEFKEFRAPAAMVWALIFSGFCMLAPTKLVTTPALNILILLCVLYFMQGLAVLLTIINRSSFSGILKVIMSVLILTQPYLAGIICIIGIFDYWADFRLPRTPQGENL